MQLPSEEARTQFVETARSLLDRAVTADPDFADAHFYRGVILLDPYNETDAAVAEFQQYLVLAAGRLRSPSRRGRRSPTAGAEAPGSDTVPTTTLTPRGRAHAWRSPPDVDRREHALPHHDQRPTEATIVMDLDPATRAEHGEQLRGARRARATTTGSRSTGSSPSS